MLDKEGKAVRGRWSIMLGGVACSFKREIGIYEGYEMWSRILCWDRKWIVSRTPLLAPELPKISHANSLCSTLSPIS